MLTNEEGTVELFPHDDFKLCPTILTALMKTTQHFVD
jgi:hypothetical protein